MFDTSTHRLGRHGIIPNTLASTCLLSRLTVRHVSKARPSNATHAAVGLLQSLRAVIWSFQSALGEQKMLESRQQLQGQGEEEMETAQIFVWQLRASAGFESSISAHSFCATCCILILGLLKNWSLEPCCGQRELCSLQSRNVSMAQIRAVGFHGGSHPVQALVM